MQCLKFSFSFCYFRTSQSERLVLVHSYEEVDCTKYQHLFKANMIDYHMSFTLNKNNQIGERIFIQIVAKLCINICIYHSAILPLLNLLSKTFKASKAPINSSFCDQWDEYTWLAAGGLHREEQASKSWKKTIRGFCVYLDNLFWICCFLKQSELDYKKF